MHVVESLVEFTPCSYHVIVEAWLPDRRRFVTSLSNAIGRRGFYPQQDVRDRGRLAWQQDSVPMVGHQAVTTQGYINLAADGAQGVSKQLEFNLTEGTDAFSHIAGDEEKPGVLFHAA